MRRLLLALMLAALAAALHPVSAQGTALPLDQIRLPEGFEISLYAGGVAGARALALGDNGTVFVGTRQAGNVYALVDGDGDGAAEQINTIARGLDNPNGVAFSDGALYVATIGQILRYDDIEANLETPPQPVVVSDDFPSERHHAWKYLRFGPDGLLYVPVGVPCDLCAEREGYGVILRLDADGTGMETFARGLRNTVGFDWHPETGELWFTDNGTDSMGDDIPPDELNRVPEAGLHFGFPYCHGGDLPDPTFGAGRSCAEFVPPVVKLPAHVAALGMRFYTGEQFPESYHNQIFIAEHGSWSRSTPIGYRVSLVTLDEAGNPLAYEPFAEGWLQNDGRFWGRPVDLLVLPDGSLLVSDDYAGAVYRISYNGS